MRLKAPGSWDPWNHPFKFGREWFQIEEDNHADGRTDGRDWLVIRFLQKRITLLR